MLASITPLGERGRHNRYATTAAWFVVGATAGGASVGLVAGAAGAAVASGTDAPGAAIAVAVLLLAAAAVAADAGALPFPTWRRQVNEQWLDEYRGWIYGVGFGYQLGLAVATIVTSAAVYLTLALAAASGVASGSPVAGIVIGAAFGLTRGVSLLAGRHIGNPSALHAFHQRMAARDAVARHFTIAVQMLVAISALTAAVVVR